MTERETPPSPERSTKSPEFTFNLNVLEPELVAELLAALGREIDDIVDHDVHGDKEIRIDKMIELLNHDLEELAISNPQRAIELFKALADHSSRWPQEAALDHMAAELWRKPDLTFADRRQIIEFWLKSLDNQELASELDRRLVGEAASMTLIAAIEADVFDGPTAQYVENAIEEKGW